MGKFFCPKCQEYRHIHEFEGDEFGDEDSCWYCGTRVDDGHERRSCLYCQEMKRAFDPAVT